MKIKFLAGIIFFALFGMNNLKAAEPYMVPYKDTMVLMVHGTGSHRYMWFDADEQGRPLVNGANTNLFYHYLLKELNMDEQYVKAYSFAHPAGNNPTMVLEFGANSYTNQASDPNAQNNKDNMEIRDKKINMDTGIQEGRSWVEQAKYEYKQALVNDTEKINRIVDPKTGEVKRIWQNWNEVPDYLLPSKLILFTHSLGNFAPRGYIHSKELLEIKDPRTGKGFFEDIDPKLWSEEAKNKAKTHPLGFYTYPVEKIIHVNPVLRGSSARRFLMINALRMLRQKETFVPMPFRLMEILTRVDKWILESNSWEELDDKMKNENWEYIITAYMAYVAADWGITGVMEAVQRFPDLSDWLIRRQVGVAQDIAEGEVRMAGEFLYKVIQELGSSSIPGESFYKSLLLIDDLLDTKLGKQLIAYGVNEIVNYAYPTLRERYYHVGDEGTEKIMKSLSLAPYLKTEEERRKWQPKHAVIAGTGSIAPNKERTFQAAKMEAAGRVSGVAGDLLAWTPAGGPLSGLEELSKDSNELYTLTDSKFWNLKDYQKVYALLGSQFGGVFTNDGDVIVEEYSLRGDGVKEFETAGGVKIFMPKIEGKFVEEALHQYLAALIAFDSAILLTESITHIPAPTEMKGMFRLLLLINFIQETLGDSHKFMDYLAVHSSIPAKAMEWQIGEYVDKAIMEPPVVIVDGMYRLLDTQEVASLNLTADRTVVPIRPDLPIKPEANWTGVKFIWPSVEVVGGTTTPNEIIVKAKDAGRAYYERVATFNHTSWNGSQQVAAYHPGITGEVAIAPLAVSGDALIIRGTLKDFLPRHPQTKFEYSYNFSGWTPIKVLNDYGHFELGPLELSEGQNIIAFKAENKAGYRTNQIMKIVKTGITVQPVLNSLVPAAESIASKNSLVLQLAYQNMKYGEGIANTINVTSFLLNGEERIASPGFTQQMVTNVTTNRLEVRYPVQLQDGRYDVVAKAVDGYKTSSYFRYSFRVDTVPPSVNVSEVNSVNPDRISTENALFSVNYDIADTGSEFVQDINIRLIKPGFLLLPATVVREDKLGRQSVGSSQWQWDGKGADGKTLADGRYDWVMTVTDEAGHKTEVRRELVIDRKAPAIRRHGSDRLVYASDAETVQLALASDEAFTGQLRIQGADGNVWHIGEMVSSANQAGEYEAATEWPMADARIGDGTYTYIAAITDEAGNPAEVRGTVKIDRTGPQIDSIQVFPLVLTAKDNYEATIRVKATDSNGEAAPFKGILIVQDSRQNEVHRTPITVTPGQEWVGGYNAEPLAKGAYHVSVRLEDSHGNPQTKGMDVIKDGSEPVITYPLAAEHVNGTVIIKGRVTDPDLSNSFGVEKYALFYRKGIHTNVATQELNQWQKEADVVSVPARLRRTGGAPLAGNEGNKEVIATDTLGYFHAASPKIDDQSDYTLVVAVSEGALGWTALATRQVRVDKQSLTGSKKEESLAELVLGPLPPVVDVTKGEGLHPTVSVRNGTAHVTAELVRKDTGGVVWNRRWENVSGPHWLDAPVTMATAPAMYLYQDSQNGTWHAVVKSDGDKVYRVMITAEDGSALTDIKTSGFSQMPGITRLGNSMVEVSGRVTQQGLITWKTGANSRVMVYVRLEESDTLLGQGFPVYIGKNAYPAQNPVRVGGESAAALTWTWRGEAAGGAGVVANGDYELRLAAEGVQGRGLRLVTANVRLVTPFEVTEMGNAAGVQEIDPYLNGAGNHAGMKYSVSKTAHVRAEVKDADGQVKVVLKDNERIHPTTTNAPHTVNWDGTWAQGNGHIAAPEGEYAIHMNITAADGSGAWEKTLPVRVTSSGWQMGSSVWDIIDKERFTKEISVNGTPAALVTGAPAYSWEARARGRLYEPITVNYQVELSNVRQDVVGYPYVPYALVAHRWFEKVKLKVNLHYRLFHSTNIGKGKNAGHDETWVEKAEDWSGKTQLTVAEPVLTGWERRFHELGGNTPGYEPDNTERLIMEVTDPDGLFVLDKFDLRSDRIWSKLRDNKVTYRIRKKQTGESVKAGLTTPEALSDAMLAVRDSEARVIELKNFQYAYCGGMGAGVAPGEENNPAFRIQIRPGDYEAITSGKVNVANGFIHIKDGRKYCIPPDKFYHFNDHYDIVADLPEGIWISSEKGMFKAKVLVAFYNWNMSKHEDKGGISLPYQSHRNRDVLIKMTDFQLEDDIRYSRLTNRYYPWLGYVNGKKGSKALDFGPYMDEPGRLGFPHSAFFALPDGEYARVWAQIEQGGVSGNMTAAEWAEWIKNYQPDAAETLPKETLLGYHYRHYLDDEKFSVVMVNQDNGPGRFYTVTPAPGTVHKGEAIRANSRYEVAVAPGHVTRNIPVRWPRKFGEADAQAITAKGEAVYITVDSERWANDPNAGKERIDRIILTPEQDVAGESDYLAWIDESTITDGPARLSFSARLERRNAERHSSEYRWVLSHGNGEDLIRHLNTRILPANVRKGSYDVQLTYGHSPAATEPAQYSRNIRLSFGDGQSRLSLGEQTAAPALLAGIRESDWASAWDSGQDPALSATNGWLIGDYRGYNAPLFQGRAPEVDARFRDAYPSVETQPVASLRSLYWGNGRTENPHLVLEEWTDVGVRDERGESHADLTVAEIVRTGENGEEYRNDGFRLTLNPAHGHDVWVAVPGRENVPAGDVRLFYRDAHGWQPIPPATPDQRQRHPGVLAFWNVARLNGTYSIKAEDAARRHMTLGDVVIGTPVYVAKPETQAVTSPYGRVQLGVAPQTYHRDKLITATPVGLADINVNNLPDISELTFMPIVEVLPGTPSADFRQAVNLVYHYTAEEAAAIRDGRYPGLVSGQGINLDDVTIYHISHTGALAPASTIPPGERWQDVDGDGQPDVYRIAASLTHFSTYAALEGVIPHQPVLQAVTAVSNGDKTDLFGYIQSAVTRNGETKRLSWELWRDNDGLLADVNDATPAERLTLLPEQMTRKEEGVSNNIQLRQVPLRDGDNYFFLTYKKEEWGILNRPYGSVKVSRDITPPVLEQVHVRAPRQAVLEPGNAGTDTAPFVFSPNGDGELDKLELSLQSSEAMEVRLAIMNERGERETEISVRASAPGQELTLRWNGRRIENVMDDPSPVRDAQEALPSGQYRGVLYAKDLAGNISEQVMIPITVDTIPPVIETGSAEIPVFSAANPAGIKEFPVRVRDNGHVQSMDVRLFNAENTGSELARYERFFLAGSDIKINLNSKEFLLNQLKTLIQNGKYNIRMEIQDMGGNRQTRDIPFILDNEPPRILAIAPERVTYNAAVITKSNGELRLKLEASDNRVPSADLFVSLWDTVGGKSREVLVMKGIYFNQYIILPVSHLIPEDGTHKLTARVSDGLNESEASVTVTIDRTPPEVTELVAGHTAFSPDSGSRFRLSARFSEPLSTGHWMITDAAQSIRVDEKFTTSYFHYTWPENSTLSDGRYTGKLFFRDRLGNDGDSFPHLIPITVDRISPQVRLHIPQPVYGPNQPVAFQAAVSDALSPTMAVNMTWTSGGLVLAEETAEWQSGVTHNRRFNPPVLPSGSGQLTLMVRARDKAGNTAALSGSLLLDMQAPSIRLDSFNGETLITSANAVVLRGEISDASAIRQVSVTATGTGNEAAKSLTPELSGKEFEVKLDTRSWTEGRYTLRITAEDEWGQRAEEQYQLVLDRTPPQIGPVEWSRTLIRQDDPDQQRLTYRLRASDNISTGMTLHVAAPEPGLEEYSRIETSKEGVIDLTHWRPAHNHFMTTLNVVMTVADEAGNRAAVTQPLRYVQRVPVPEMTLAHREVSPRLPLSGTVDVSPIRRLQLPNARLVLTLARETGRAAYQTVAVLADAPLQQDMFSFSYTIPPHLEESDRYVIQCSLYVDGEPWLEKVMLASRSESEPYVRISNTPPDVSGIRLVKNNSDVSSPLFLKEGDALSVRFPDTFRPAQRDRLEAVRLTLVHKDTGVLSFEETLDPVHPVSQIRDLPDGLYTAVVTLRQKNGLEARRDFPVVLDNVAPEVSLVEGPLLFKAFQEQFLPIAIRVSEDHCRVTHVVQAKDGTPLGTLWADPSRFTGSQVIWNGLIGPDTYLEDGLYDLVLTVTDRAGNATMFPIEVTHVAHFPDLWIAAGFEAMNPELGPKTLTVNTGIALEQVEYRFVPEDHASASPVVFHTVDRLLPGAHSVPFTGYDETGRRLPDGPYRITVRGQSLLGTLEAVKVVHISTRVPKITPVLSRSRLHEGKTPLMIQNLTMPDDWSLAIHILDETGQVVRTHYDKPLHAPLDQALLTIPGFTPRLPTGTYRLRFETKTEAGTPFTTALPFFYAPDIRANLSVSPSQMLPDSAYTGGEKAAFLTPNQDGRQDDLAITIQAGGIEPAYFITAQIRDRNGAIFRELADNRALSPGSDLLLKWNGDASEGEYQLAVTLRSEYGDILAEKVFPVMVSAQGPVISASDASVRYVSPELVAEPDKQSFMYHLRMTDALAPVTALSQTVHLRAVLASVETGTAPVIVTADVDTRSHHQWDFSLSATQLRQLPDGNYDLTIYGTDVLGNEAQYRSRILVIDRRSPEPPVISSGSGLFTSVTEDTLLINAGDGDRLRVFHNRNLIYDGNGIPSLPVPLLAGENRFEAVAADKAGNHSATSNAVIRVLDTMPPGVENVTFSETNPGFERPLSVRFYFNEPMDIAHLPEIRLAQEGESNGIAPASVEWLPQTGYLHDASFSYATELVAVFLMDQPGVSATYNAVLSPAADLAGNMTHHKGFRATAAKIFIDTLQPALPILRIPAEVTNEDYAVIAVTKEPGTRLEILWNGASRHYAVSASEFTVADLPLQLGPNTIRARVTDAAGNTSPWTEPLTITRETTAPYVLSHTPLDRPVKAGPLLFEAEFSESLSTTPQIRLTHGAGQVFTDTVSMTGDAARLEARFTITAGVNGPAAIELLDLRDEAGNTGEFRRTFMLDTASPNILNVRLTPATATRNITLRFDAAEPLQNDPLVRLRSNGTDHPFTQIRQSGQTYEYAIAVTSQNMAEGPASVRITLEDMAGNVSTINQEGVTIDTRAPELVSPSFSRLITSTGNVEFSFLVSEPLAGNPVVSVNETPAVFRTLTNGVYTYRYAVKETDPQGTARIRVMVTDTHGNSTTHHLNGFAIDTIPPDLRLDPPVHGYAGTGEFSFILLSNEALAATPQVMVNNKPATPHYVQDDQYQFGYRFGSADLQGPSVLTVSATDTAGNTTARTWDGPVVDTVPPAVAGVLLFADRTGATANLSAVPEDVYYAAGLLRFTARFSEPVSTPNLRMEAGFRTQQLTPVAFDGLNAVYTLILNSGDWPAEDNLEARVVLENAADQAGNSLPETPQEFRFLMDLKAPQVIAHGTGDGEPVGIIKPYDVQGEGERSRLKLWVELDEPAETAVITIRDVRTHEPVRRLTSLSMPDPSGPYMYEVLWDGRNEQGELLGREQETFFYYVTIETRDRAGNGALENLDGYIKVQHMSLGVHIKPDWKPAEPVAPGLGHGVTLNFSVAVKNHAVKTDTEFEEEFDLPFRAFSTPDKTWGTLSLSVYAQGHSAEPVYRHQQPITRVFETLTHYWNGRYDAAYTDAAKAGALVPDGTYEIRIEAVDSAGNPATHNITENNLVIIDNTPPMLTALTPEKAYTNQNTVGITWDGTDITDARHHLRVWYRVSENAEMGWTTVIPTATVLPLMQTEGRQTLLVRLTDRAGNASEPFAAVVVRDTIAPSGTLAFLSGMASSIWEGHREVSGNLAVQVNWTDANPAQWTLHMAEISRQGTAAEERHDLNTAALAGIHPLVFTMTDLAGNETTATYSVYTDATAPVFSAERLGNRYTSAAAIPVRFSDIRDSSFPLTLLRLGQSGQWQTVQSVTSGNNGFSITENIFVEGDHVFHYVLRDRLGNLSPSASVQVYYDATPPVVSADRSAPSWQTAPVGDITLTAGDNGSGLPSLPLRYRWTAEGHVPDAAGWISAESGAVTTLPDGNDGRYRLELVATDKAGNTGTWSGPYYQDTQLPVLTFEAPSGSQWHTVPSRVTVNATDLTSGIQAVRYAWDGESAETSGTPLSVPATLPLPEGEHTLHIWVEDQAGNAVLDSMPLRQDTRMPSYLLSGASPDVWHNSPASVQVTLQDATPGSGVFSGQYRWDEGAWTPFNATPNGIITLPEGIHRLSLQVTDRAGNRITEVLNGIYKRDTTPPQMGAPSLETEPLKTGSVITIIPAPITETYPDRTEYAYRVGEFASPETGWHSDTRAQASISPGAYTFVPEPALKKGDRVEIRVRHYDQAGNMATGTYSAVVANSAPQLLSVAPLRTQLTADGSTILPIEVTLTDADGWLDPGATGYGVEVMINRGSATPQGHVVWGQGAVPAETLENGPVGQGSRLGWVGKHSGNGSDHLTVLPQSSATELINDTTLKITFAVTLKPQWGDVQGNIISAMVRDGDGAISPWQIAAAAFNVLPASPAALVISTANFTLNSFRGDIRLQWQNPAQDTATHFYIMRRINAGATETLVSDHTGTTFTDTQVPDESIYTYTVYTANSAGHNPVPAQASVLIGDYSSPDNVGAPALSVTPGALNSGIGQVTAIWPQSPDTGFARYEITVARDAERVTVDSVIVTNRNQTSHTFTLPDRQQVAVKVAVVDTAGNRSTATWSDSVTLPNRTAPVLTVAPDPPQLFWLDQGLNSADIQKVRVHRSQPGSEAGITHWAVTRSSGGGTTTTDWLPVAMTEWIDDGVSDNQTVRYAITWKKVDAEGNYGMSPESSEAALLIPDRTAPAPVNIGTIAFSGVLNSGICTVEAVNFTAETGATLYYELYRDDVLYRSEQANPVFTNVPGDGTQRYVVRAHARDSEQNYSAPLFSQSGTCDRTAPSGVVNTSAGTYHPLQDNALLSAYVMEDAGATLLSYAGGIYRDQEKVADLAAGTTVPGELTALWGGLNSTGNYVSAGIYHVRVSVTDEAGNSSELVSTPFTVTYTDTVSAYPDSPALFHKSGNTLWGVSPASANIHIRQGNTSGQWSRPYTAAASAQLINTATELEGSQLLVYFTDASDNTRYRIRLPENYEGFAEKPFAMTQGYHLSVYRFEDASPTFFHMFEKEYPAYTNKPVLFNTGDPNDASPPELKNQDRKAAIICGFITLPRNAPQGDYVFKLSHDDGARLWFNGRLIYDDPDHTSGQPRSAQPVQLQPGGTYPFILRHHDLWDNSYLYLFYSVNGGPNQLVPAEWFTLEDPAHWDISPMTPRLATSWISGIHSYYYDNGNIGTGELIRSSWINQQINFSWGTGKPGYSGNMDGDIWSSRHTTHFYVTEPGIYRFQVTSDDGARFHLHDQVIMDHWGPASGIWNAPQEGIQLEQGLHRMMAEHMEHLGSAGLTVQYQRLINGNWTPLMNLDRSVVYIQLNGDTDQNIYYYVSPIDGGPIISTIGTDANPSIPVLESPSGNLTLTTETPLFIWQDAGDPSARYRLDFRYEGNLPPMGDQTMTDGEIDRAIPLLPAEIRQLPSMGPASRLSYTPRWQDSFQAGFWRWQVAKISTDNQEVRSQSATFEVQPEPAIHGAINYPNPFRKKTTIRYKLSLDADTVTIRIFTAAGNLVRTLDGDTAGTSLLREYNSVEWDGKNDWGEDVVNGVYMYRITAEYRGKTLQASGKMVKLR